MAIWTYGINIGILAFVAFRNYRKVKALQQRITELEKKQSVNKVITGAMIINDMRLFKLEMKIHGQQTEKTPVL